MVITAHFEAKGMDSGLQNYLSTIAETSNLDSITGKEYVFLTNNFSWTAKTVASPLLWRA